MPTTVLPFKLERTDESITPHAGLAVAHEFHLGLKVDRLLDEHLPCPGSGRGYAPSDVVLPLLLMLQGGGEDLEDIGVIRRDRALRTVARLSAVPAATTAYDGTVGYQPLLGFLFECRWVLADEFRTGCASPQAGLVAFVKHCRGQMPPGQRVARVRSDSAAYNHDVTDYCEDHGLQYVIGADWDSAVVEAYRAIPAESWTPFLARNSRREREVAETIHTFNEGHSSFRLVFVRDVDSQKELWPDRPRGRAIITNIPDDKMTGVQVVDCYNDRGTAENFLKELKWGFGLRRLPCGQFDANARCLPA